ncbi:hypothetical protein [uncultured Mailhella sp.]|nr:hypothetical protein [uncultured Mailhella sp.]
MNVRNAAALLKNEACFASSLLLCALLCGRLSGLLLCPDIP